MLDEGQDCEAVVTQLAAAKAALDRVSYRLVAAGMRHCTVGAVDAMDNVPVDDTPSSESDRMDLGALEKLFLKLS